MTDTSNLDLSSKQERFCQEYIVDSNGTQAAIRAGYAEGSAGQMAYKLLKKPEIQVRIAQLQREVAERNNLTVDRTIEELRRVLFFNPRDLVAADGNLIPLHKLPPEVTAAITGYDVETRINGEGEVVKVTKIRFTNKLDAIEKAMRKLGLFREDNAQRSTLSDLMAWMQANGKPLPIRQ